MNIWETADLLETRAQSGKPYLEFVRAASMSCGVYELPRGGHDAQTPHAEDEVYYVVRGRAQIRVGSLDRPVSPGTVVFVPARIEHRFHDMLEDLTVLVFFAPPEGSNRRSGNPPG